jgi:uncharacterized membrane protein YebE (DUF533 family)
VADDKIQITTPLGYTFLAPIRSERTVSRIRGLAGVSQVARALHEHYKIEPVEDAPRQPWPAAPPPPTESHELLTPLTAATLSQMHTVESELMIRAMIEAAKSDGAIDPEERRRILTCLKDAGTIEPDHQALLKSMDAPPDVDGLVQRVTNPELAVEVYAASLLAIKDDTPTQQHYLARLAERLNLPADTVREMHARFGDPPPIAPEG